MNSDSVNKLVSIWWMLCIILAVVACSPDKNTTSSAPELNLLGQYVYNSGYGYDSFILFQLNYSDNDGDLGLNDNDTFGSFGFGRENYNNFFCLYWVKQNGKWLRPLNPMIPKDTLNLNERWPNITPTGNSKSVYGKFDLIVPARPYGFRGDTVKFSFQLVDRQLHRSKWIESKIFTLKHP